MKLRVLGCVVCMMVFGGLALRGTVSSAWFYPLTAADERMIVAGQEGYYCGAGTGECQANGAAPGSGDAAAYWCSQSQDKQDCSATWCPGGAKNEKCLLATWGFQWLYSCTERTQGCEKSIAVCKHIQGGVYGCGGSRTVGYTGCGNRTACD